MDSIIIRVDELAQKVSEMVGDGMDYVELTLTEAEPDLPAAVLFSAFKEDFPVEHIDYEEVDAAEL